MMRRYVYALGAIGLAAIAVLLASRAVGAHEVPRPCDFTTGGGFVFKTTTGGRVNFGIVGGCKHEGFYGHVNIVDHETGVHINGKVTGYFDPIIPGPGYRDICATDSKTGAKVRVRTKDNGEPGGSDRFGAKTSDGRLFVPVTDLGPSPAGPRGGGGNIQLHKGNNSNTGPAVPPSDFAVCGDDAGLGS
jgi:hypothetical protein